MDIAEDIKTSFDEYSQEVIRLAKKALHKYGYNLWSPTEEDIEKNGWEDEEIKRLVKLHGKNWFLGRNCCYQNPMLRMTSLQFPVL